MPMVMSQSRPVRDWGSRSMKRRWRAARPRAIAGVRRYGVMTTDLLRSGEMTQIAAALTGKPTRHRYMVMLMLFVSVVITYLDRSNISITAPAMGKELGF